MIHAVQEGRELPTSAPGRPHRHSTKNPQTQLLQQHQQQQHWNKTDHDNLPDPEEQAELESEQEKLKRKHFCIRMWRYLKSTWSGVMTRQGITP